MLYTVKCYVLILSVGPGIIPTLLQLDLPLHVLRLRDTRARAMRNVYLSSLTKNLWYEQREQLDPRGGGALSQGAGHDGSFY